ncbi:MaoC family dehydratase [Pseudomonas sp. 8O]|uniref:MaoC family dehydratase n=1 Tax=Pseudomonas sp. 8O TaxID=2653165 RepID=UPI0012F1F589|nr:MaoC family dehydratase [Pseudomonas sp. 8O]VXB12182.1 MaoC domain-containing protein dehydratase [Pseudomonas sp. 8O]
MNTTTTKTKIPEIGYEVRKHFLLSKAEIVEGARFIGDLNPLHVDNNHPDTVRLGGLIASGSHITALFSALLPTDFIAYGPMLGAHMDVKFTAPVLPDTRYLMRWQVEEKQWKESLQGTVYSMAGSITNDAGNSIVRAKAAIILYPKQIPS